jgi:hypothetical protein
MEEMHKTGRTPTSKCHAGPDQNGPVTKSVYASFRQIRN